MEYTKPKTPKVSGGSTEKKDRQPGIKYKNGGKVKKKRRFKFGGKGKKKTLKRKKRKMKMGGKVRSPY